MPRNPHHLSLPLLFIAIASINAAGQTHLYATNGSDAITVFDLKDNRLVATIPLPELGGGRAVVSPDGKLAYFTTIKSIAVVETASNRVIADIPACCNLYGLAISPDGAFVYVPGTQYHSVSIIDTKSNRMIANVSAGVMPTYIAISPDGSSAYVTNSGSDDVSVIDTHTRAVAATIPVGYQPRGLSFTPDGAFVYVANGVSDDVSVIDAATRRVVAIIPVGSTPLGAKFSPDGARVYILNLNSHDLSVIEPASRRVIATIPLPEFSGDVAVTDDAVYVGGPHSVLVIDARTNTVRDTVPLAKGAVGLAVWPDVRASVRPPRKAGEQPAYLITNLGPKQSEAVDINDSGQVIGYSLARGPGRAFLWDKGRVTDLGSLGRLITTPTGINNLGEIVGSARSDRGHAFIFQNGSMRSLEIGAGLYSSASGLNNRGQVVGTFQTQSGGPSHAFLYDNAKTVDLGTLGGSNSAAYAINDAGIIVGAADLKDKSSHAFLYQNGRMQDLGSLGGTNSRAQAISNSGIIVGSAEIDRNKTTHAFIYQDGRMKDLGTFGGGDRSEAFGVNISGQVVGFGYTVRGRRAFLYSAGVMQDLTDLLPPNSRWILNDAYAINDAGQIVGRGMLHTAMSSFLLTPMRDTPESISAQASMPSLSSMSYFIEAESGILSFPITVFCEAEGGGREYIASVEDKPATATFFIDVIRPGPYVIWLRLISQRETETLSVSVDNGKPRDFKLAKSEGPVSWQWMRISEQQASSRSSAVPLLFDLFEGPHELTFRIGAMPREATKIDRLIITNDQNFDPRR